MKLHIRHRSSSLRPGPSLAVLLGLAAALLAGTPAYAQDRTAEIGKLFSWVTPGTPGCAVAVSQHGKVVVTSAYGLADLERDVAISPATIFDAASVVKQFVAAATLLIFDFRFRRPILVRIRFGNFFRQRAISLRESLAAMAKSNS